MPLDLQRPGPYSHFCKGETMTAKVSSFSNGQATHFVLTRFNVRNFYHRAEPTDEWLMERMALFRTYCMPCFTNQSIRDFNWIVFFDSETPKWFRKEIEAAAKNLFEPVFVKGEFSKEVVSRTIADRCTTRFAITTRVDNDDAVAFDFVESIQSCFAHQDLVFVNLVNGAQYANGRTYLRPYTKNPFSSLIEDVSHRRPLTVFAEHHYRIDHFAPVMNVRTSHPMWLQVIHGGNVLNEVVGLRVSGPTVAKHFPCALDTHDSALSLAVEGIIGTLRIGLRLLRKPHRFIELSRTLWARKSASDTSE